MIRQTHYWAYNLRRSESKRQRHPNVHCSNIYNRQDLKATKMSIDNMNGQRISGTYTQWSISQKKNETLPLEHHR